MWAPVDRGFDLGGHPVGSAVDGATMLGVVKEEREGRVVADGWMGHHSTGCGKLTLCVCEWLWCGRVLSAVCGRCYCCASLGQGCVGLLGGGESMHCG